MQVTPVVEKDSFVEANNSFTYFVTVYRLVTGNSSNSACQLSVQLNQDICLLTGANPWDPTEHSHYSPLSTIAQGWKPDPWIRNRRYLVM